MDLITLILFLVGLVVLIAGAEVLVGGASRLALSIGIPPLIVGLTVVSIGTSAPELATNIVSSLTGHADIALGNVVGSNTANILLVLGFSALLGPLIVAPQLLRLDVPTMIGLSLLLILMSKDGVINLLDGVMLVLMFVLYTSLMIAIGRKEQQVRGARDQRGSAQADARSEQKGSTTSPSRLATDAGMVVVGVGMLTIGSRWLVDGAVALAHLFGLSELVIGLTIVAVGTSSPELATSVMASLRGQRDIAVGNAIGSNIFNILVVLGVSSIAAPQGIPVLPEAKAYDIPIMAAVAAISFPLLSTGQIIARWEGFLLFGYYLIYTAYLVLRSTQHPMLDTFSTLALTVIGVSFLLILFHTVWSNWGTRARQIGS